MKNILDISCLTLLIFIVALNVLAQGTKISEQEFSNLQNKAFETLKSSSYRERTTSKSFENKNYSEPDAVIVIIYEKNSDGYHQIRETKNVGGNTRTEKIKIGNREFVRDNNENWREMTSQDRREGVLFNDGSEVESTSEYKYLGKVIINKKKAEGYEIRSTVTYKSVNNERTNTHLERVWFDQQGRYLKEESYYEVDGKLIPHLTIEYEYDPNIKIEAPLNGESKAGKIIENSELDEIKAKAENLLKGLSYRKEEITEVYAKNGSKLLQKISKVYELLPPERFYYSEIDEKGGKTKKTEFVRFYDMRYERINGGKWRNYSQKNSDSFSMKVTKKQKETQFLGTEKLGDKTAIVYEVFEKYTSSTEGDMESEKKYWFDEKGFLLKSDTKETKLRDSNVTKILEKFDYDAKIEIEEPKIRP